LVLFGGGWQTLDGAGFVVRAFAAAGSGVQLRLAVRGPAGQVSIGERRPGGPVQWRPATADDGWRPAIDTDLVWAVPAPESAWLFASGADGTVRVLSAAEGIWRAVSPDTAPKSALRPGSTSPAARRARSSSSRKDQTTIWSGPGGRELIVARGKGYAVFARSSSLAGDEADLDGP